MLALLVGTSGTRERERGIKSPIQKVTKEWYYDHNVWKVVLQFGIHACVALPYRIKKQHLIVDQCQSVFHVNNRPAYLRTRDFKPFYIDGTEVPIPGYLGVEYAEWISGNDSGSGELLITTCRGNVYICKFNGTHPLERVTKRRIRECGPVVEVTSRGDILAWVSRQTLSLHISSRHCNVNHIIHHNRRFPSCRRRVAIDSKGLIYVATAYKSARVYYGSEFLYDIELPIESHASYIVIFSDTIHVLCSNGTLVACTLKGELLSSYHFEVAPTSMCVTDKGELLLSNGPDYFIM
jgi:hypothetical protein